MVDDLSRTPPEAFLSHASEDKAEFTAPLGRALARLGVKPWLDQWEIRPGDSLIRKLFDEGVAVVDAVVIVVSRHSITKPWVREELDSAAVRRIQEGTRIIPVRLDDAEVPAPLRHLVWITTDRTAEGIADTAQRIADTLHGVDPRPTVASPPDYTTSDAIPGLTKGDTLVLTESLREALDTERLNFLDWNKIKSQVEAHGLAGEGLMESVLALTEDHYLEVKIHGQDLVLAYTITTSGYRIGIEAVAPSIQAMKQQVMAAIVNDPPSGDRVIHDLADRTGVPLLIVDETLRELEAKGLIAVSRTLGRHSRLHRVSPTLRRHVA